MRTFLFIIFIIFLSVDLAGAVISKVTSDLNAHQTKIDEALQ